MFMPTEITINLRKKLIKIHKSRRRNRAVKRLKEEVARKTKVNIEKVSISKRLNRHIILTMSKNLKPVKVSIDKSGDSAKISLPGEDKKVEKPVAPVKESGTKDKAAETMPAPIPKKKEERTDTTPKAEKEENVEKK